MTRHAALRGSAKLTGGAPGLQIRCEAVKAVSGGFDSHALPPIGWSGGKSRKQVVSARRVKPQNKKGGSRSPRPHVHAHVLHAADFSSLVSTSVSLAKCRNCWTGQCLEDRDDNYITNEEILPLHSIRILWSHNSTEYKLRRHIPVQDTNESTKRDEFEVLYS